MTVSARRQAEGSAPQSGGPEDDALDRLADISASWSERETALATVREALERQTLLADERARERDETDHHLSHCRGLLEAAEAENERLRTSLEEAKDEAMRQGDGHTVRALPSASPTDGGGS